MESKIHSIVITSILAFALIAGIPAAFENVFAQGEGGDTSGGMPGGEGMTGDTGGMNGGDSGMNGGDSGMNGGDSGMNGGGTSGGP